MLCNISVLQGPKVCVYSYSSSAHIKHYPFVYVQIVEDSASIIKRFKPMGNGYSEIIPDVSDFSNPEKAFRQSIGKDRKIRVLEVQVSLCQPL